MAIERCHTRTAIVLAGVLALSFSATAKADELRSKGTVLTGTVKDVSEDEVTFETEYGEGTIVVAMEDVEDLRSDGRFIVVHGPSGRTSGKILGLHDGKLVIGDDEGATTEIELADIHAVVDIEGPEDTFANNMRRRLALWDGFFDLGFGLTRSTTDTTNLSIGFLADRKKRPTRLTFETGYRYGKEKDDEDSNLTEKEATAALRGEYDFAPKWFTFGSVDAEHDRVESLDIRTVPKAGVGYRFWEVDDSLFQVEVGGAYVYEKFDGGDENDYFSLVLGKLLEYEIPYLDSHFHWRTDFLPAIDDWNDYLVRTDLALLVPMYKSLNFKFTVEDEYDKTPAEDAEKNNFKTTVGVAVVY